MTEHDASRTKVARSRAACAVTAECCATTAPRAGTSRSSWSRATPGERGIFVPLAEDEVIAEVGAAADYIPEGMARAAAPDCPRSPSTRCCATTCATRR